MWKHSLQLKLQMLDSISIPSLKLLLKRFRNQNKRLFKPNRTLELHANSDPKGQRIVRIRRIILSSQLVTLEFCRTLIMLALLRRLEPKMTQLALLRRLKLQKSKESTLKTLLQWISLRGALWRAIVVQFGVQTILLRAVRIRLKLGRQMEQN